ncbi:MAG: hypothetical protein JWL60_76, partial [Gemmatimonadetes bacterium]|nr:hypothetical protein [Gemmatimonadota bacterium]
SFGPDNVNAGRGSALLSSSGSARARVPGGTISVTGGAASNAILAGAFTAVRSQLESGSMTLRRADSGSVTITFAPALGRQLAGAIDPRAASSVEATDAARFGTAVALEANGLERGSAVRTTNALLEVARMQAAQASMHPAAASMAAAHAASAVAQMSNALAAFMLDEPKSPIPAPMLAAGIVVRAAAATALPLPSSITR